MKSVLLITTLILSLSPKLAFALNYSCSAQSPYCSNGRVCDTEAGFCTATPTIWTASFQAVTNDKPEMILSCRESRHGALVIDGAKTLSISRDQFGSLTLNVIQKDQFSGNVELIKNLSLTQKVCQGFVPCQTYEANQGATRFFVNLLPNFEEGHLGSPKTGEVEFICQR
jgi:hypothetical protein